MKKTIIITLILCLNFFVLCSNKASEVKEITSENFAELIKDGITIVEFRYEKCDSCDMIEKRINNILENYDNIEFGKLIVENNQEFIDQIRIQLRKDSPTVIIFINGTPADGFMGVQPDTVIEEKLIAIKKNHALMEKLATGEINFMDAYDFTLPDLEGNPITLSKIEGLIILDFWATWCRPCVEEIPYLQQFYEDYKDKGLSIVGVCSQTPDKVNEFIKQQQKKGVNITYILLLDTNKEVTKKFKIRSIPTTYFISPDGKLIKKETGFTKQMLEDYEKLIKENLPKEK